MERSVIKQCICLALLLLGVSAAGQAPAARPTVAVVLSGGGAKGVAHIEALRAVEQAGLPVDIVCGTSMGALIGGLYSIGWTCDELDSLVRTQDWLELFSDRVDPSLLNLRQRQEQNTYALIRGLNFKRMPEPSGGVIRGRNLAKLFRTLCYGWLDSVSFDSLPVRFACVATDLAANEEVDFRSGRLTQALRASMAIPGVFTPVRLGQRVLVDGGLKNNYPCDLARAMGADIVVGMTVQNELLEADELTDAASILGQIIDISTKDKYQSNLARTDVMMTVDVSGYSAASFYPAAIDTLLRRGREVAQSHADELASLRRRYRLDSVAAPGPRHFEAPDSVANPRHHRVSPTPTAGVGFRFDAEDMGALQLALDLPYNLESAMPMRSRLTVRLGRQLMVGAEQTFLADRTNQPSAAYTFRLNDLDYYIGGDRLLNIKYRHHHASLLPVNVTLKNFIIRLGLDVDFYDYYGRLLSAINGLQGELDDDLFVSYRFDLEHNCENRWYFPTRGAHWGVRTDYITDNFHSYDGDAPLVNLSAFWRVSLALSERLTLQPMVCGRLLYGNSTPLPYATVLGSEWYSNYMPGKLPFDGTRYLEFVDRNTLCASVRLQYRFLKNHYVLLRGSLAYTQADLKIRERLPDLWGASLGYFYNTMFGPAGLVVSYNSRVDRPALHVTLGHWF